MRGERSDHGDGVGRRMSVCQCSLSSALCYSDTARPQQVERQKGDRGDGAEAARRDGPGDFRDVGDELLVGFCTLRSPPGQHPRPPTSDQTGETADRTYYTSLSMTQLTMPGTDRSRTIHHALEDLPGGILYPLALPLRPRRTHHRDHRPQMGHRPRRQHVSPRPPALCT